MVTLVFVCFVLCFAFEMEQRDAQLSAEKMQHTKLQTIMETHIVLLSM